ncbi:MAG: hypothetical protein GEU96_00185 [Propionibacteriales bacterium]|nr:hypothetical protein [Propionibacteriales bacterium]
MPDASAVSLSAFLDASVEPGSRVVTDGWSAFPRATRDSYEHTGVSVAASGLAADEELPAVHRVFSLVKRWLVAQCRSQSAPSTCRPTSMSGCPVQPATIAQSGPRSSTPSYATRLAANP